MPVDEQPPTASVEAGSKPQVVTLCDALYQFYRAGYDCCIRYLANLLFTTYW